MAHFCWKIGDLQQSRKTCLLYRTLLVIVICVFAGTAVNSLWRGHPEQGVKVLWSSRSNLRNYSGSSLLLAILWFWRLNLQLESAPTLLKLKILLFHQSYFCRTARSCAFPEKAFYHDRSHTEASDPVSGSSLSSQAFLPHQSALSNLLRPDLSSKWFPKSEWKDEATVGPVSSTL